MTIAHSMMFSGVLVLPSATRSLVIVHTAFRRHTPYDLLMSTGTASPDQEIEKFKQQWDQLSNVDRARAVRKIKLSGISIRGIARQLGRSDASLRHLLKVLDAPAADLAAARQRSISTNAKAARQRQAARKRADAQRERERKAMEGAKLICEWLQKNNVSGPDGECIINMVRDKFMLAYRTGTPAPKINVPPGRSPNQLIELCRPKRPMPNDAENTNWYADWLLWSVLHVLPDADVRDRALDIALEAQ